MHFPVWGEGKANSLRAIRLKVTRRRPKNVESWAAPAFYIQLLGERGAGNLPQMHTER